MNKNMNHNLPRHTTMACLFIGLLGMMNGCGGDSSGESELTCQDGLIMCGGRCCEICDEYDVCKGKEIEPVKKECTNSSETLCGESCYNLLTDRNHCGSCDNVCKEDEECKNSSCVKTCGENYTLIDNQCIDLLNDSENCGKKDNKCPDITYCSAGKCVCTNGYELHEDGCYDANTDNEHCGSANTQCLSNMQCMKGECTCPNGTWDCDNDASNGCEATVSCDKVCQSGEVICGSDCSDLSSDANNCGVCGKVCQEDQICSSSECVCPENTTLCSDGCVSLKGNPLHCGSCDTVCTPNQKCDITGEEGSEYSCQDIEGFSCDETSEKNTACWGECFDILTDVKHCGSCSTECYEGWNCEEGVCTIHCQEGEEICGKSCVNTKTDNDNCGVCGNECLQGYVCTEGECEFRGDENCSKGELDCYGTCKAVMTDKENCGACLRKCGDNATCEDGQCVIECTDGMTRCGTPNNYACYNLLTSKTHCGACEGDNIVCKAGQDCVNGACECAAGHFDCDNDPSNGCESTTDCSCKPGSKRACWNGAAENRNVGRCSDGEQVCGEDGNSWGPCLNAVYPMQHTCDDAGLNYLQDTIGLDVNCDGIDDSEQECITECDVKAGSTSYIGCEYWPAFLQNEDGYSTTTNVYFDLTLVMSNPSKYDSATVYVFDQSAQNKSENQASPVPKYSYTLKPGEVKTETLVGKAFGTYTNKVGDKENCLNTSSPNCKANAAATNIDIDKYMIHGTQKSAKAFRVVSTSPIVVYQFNPYGKPETHSADASLLMPRSVLGKEYLSMGFDSRTGTTAAMTAKFADSMNIVAVEKGNTKVTVKFKAPTVAGASGSGINSYNAGDSATFTLKRFEVLSLQQNQAKNSTGTSITADKKIAVYGSAGCAQVPTDKSACDHLEEQLFPLQSWGTSYAAVKTRVRGTEDDYYYILAQKNDTYVNIQGGVQNKSRTLQAGEYMVINTSQNFAVKSTDPTKPILVGQFMVGSQANAAGKGDPSFILNVPIEQYRSEYSFSIPGGYDEDYVTIIAPGTVKKPPAIKYTGAGHKGYTCSNGKQACDNVDISSLPETVFSGWKTLAGSTKVFDKQSYVYGYLDLDGGTHNLSSTVQFGVTGYGFFNDTSYGYPIGLDLKILNTN